MIDIELRKALKNINLKDITEILIHHDKVKDRFIFVKIRVVSYLKKMVF
ncbi:MAG TPA: hypothetical protein PKZ43_07515 [Bacteroidales bacterium]|nr:hypothetical protein [Bacteroidales bacterium]